jgi:hypothetical protein
VNPDQKLIQSAYEDAIRKLYAQLFDSYAQSGGDAGAEQEAEQIFIKGVGFARKSRDRAATILA